MPFSSPPLPTIETDRLKLRAWQEDDLAALLKIFGDDEAARYVGGARPDWVIWRHFGTILGHWYLRGYTFFALEENQSGKCIGYAGPWFPDGWPEPEIGYAIIPDAHGKGYASEAARAALKFAYEQLGWQTAVSVMMKENEGSKGVARKLGAQYDGETKLFGTEPAEIWRYPSPDTFKS